MMELVWTSIGAIVLLFCIAWLAGSIALSWWFWKHRDKSWEDGIEWDVQPTPYTGEHVVIKEAEYGGRYDRVA